LRQIEHKSVIFAAIFVKSDPLNATKTAAANELEFSDEKICCCVHASWHQCASSISSVKAKVMISFGEKWTLRCTHVITNKTWQAPYRGCC
jgi:hypothetical protein